MSVLDADADAIAGGTVSTVTAKAAICAAVAGAAEGARYVREPAVPTSWRRYRPSGTRRPPTVPFHVQRVGARRQPG